jgi:hypothetical protein
LAFSSGQQRQLQQKRLLLLHPAPTSKPPVSQSRVESLPSWLLRGLPQTRTPAAISSIGILMLLSNKQQTHIPVSTTRVVVKKSCTVAVEWQKLWTRKKQLVNAMVCYFLLLLFLLSLLGLAIFFEWQRHAHLISWSFNSLIHSLGQFLPWRLSGNDFEKSGGSAVGTTCVSSITSAFCAKLQGLRVAIVALGFVDISKTPYIYQIMWSFY